MTGMFLHQLSGVALPPWHVDWWDMQGNGANVRPYVNLE
jgi:hypothetical protein